ncbi:MAG TPA: hypothetical protein PK020_19650, partial [Ilumatobacteraceae bacterium]|nr:hypothetical protein [Ilumatobacteraceae bacterium]
MGIRSKGPLRRIAALTLVAALAAACGGNDPSSSTQAPTPVDSAATGETTPVTDAPVLSQTTGHNVTVL